MKGSGLTIPISDSIGSVSAEIVNTEKKMKAVLVLAHGAGAGMKHPFMRSLSDALANVGIGSLRYNFPYMENKKNRPDPPAVAEKTVEAAIAKAHELLPDIPLLAGGKSFGGRMTSQYASQKAPEFLRGLIFFGFPLHAPGQPSTNRAEHLRKISLPMLFLQGTRDALAQLDLIKGVVATLPTADIITYEGADHSFKAGKKVFIEELAESSSSWLQSLKSSKV